MSLRCGLQPRLARCHRRNELIDQTFIPQIKPTFTQVSIDDVVEKIEGMEDHVQSVDIQSFNKL